MLADDDYEEEYIDDSEEAPQIPLADASDIRRGPVSPVATNMREYDTEALSYLIRTMEDDLLPQFVSSVNAAKLTYDTKTKLVQLATQYTSLEIVLTNLNLRDTQSCLLNFRSVLATAKVGIRGIDRHPQLYLLFAQLEDHYKLKLTRAKLGFERIQQQSIHQTQSSTHENIRQAAKDQKGFGKMLRNIGR